MVRYKVKADLAAENETYIAAVFEQLGRERPGGLHYASFRLPDGVTFVHIVAHEDPRGANPLTALATFKAFTADIRDRCEEAPTATDLQEVGSYRFFVT